MRAFGALRSSEWLLIAYFMYVAAIAPAFPLQSEARWRPAAVALLVAALLAALAYGEANEHRMAFSMARDWLAVALALVAYREMDWFSPLAHNFHSSFVGCNGTGPSFITRACSEPSNHSAR